MSDATLVYDDSCGFCTWWADLIANRTDLDLVGFSELSDRLRDRLPASYDRCAHLVTDDTVYSCGAAIEEALLRTDRGSELASVVVFLRQFDDYERLRERAYRWAADNRDTLGLIVSKTPPVERDSDDGSRE